VGWSRKTNIIQLGWGGNGPDSHPLDHTQIVPLRPSNGACTWPHGGHMPLISKITFPFGESAFRAQGDCRHTIHRLCPPPRPIDIQEVAKASHGASHGAGFFLSVYLFSALFSFICADGCPNTTVTYGFFSM